MFGSDFELTFDMANNSEKAFRLLGSLGIGKFSLNTCWTFLFLYKISAHCVVIFPFGFNAKSFIN